jgi:Pumilio-family RNA binding repeat
MQVATHRHGCCVLQRCIDFASDAQRQQLVDEISANALSLVQVLSILSQDAFGNYVVQYVLDLTDGRYSDAIVSRFIGNVCTLSIQKFSSNVIEKVLAH